MGLFDRFKNQEARGQEFYCIVGLGNPGREYAETKHNVGFCVIDKLAEKYEIKVEKYKNRALIGDGMIRDKRVLLVKPQTFMNLSGESVREIVNFLRSKIPNLTSVVQNINTGRNNIIMGKECKILWGASHITDRLGSLKFKISALSFFQVNTEQAEKLYECALKYANLTGKETVIDGYCGTGTISLFLAQKAKKVYGMEIVPEAIRDAIANARDNNIRNAEFLTGDAAKLMPQLYRKGLRPDVIVTDPPRAGCAPEVLKTFAAMRPKRIVYVSCNPASLARDIGILDELGYKATEIQPVDMFPQTGHVESVCLLIKK